MPLFILRIFIIVIIAAILIALLLMVPLAYKEMNNSDKQMQKVVNLLKQIRDNTKKN